MKRRKAELPLPEQNDFSARLEYPPPPVAGSPFNFPIPEQNDFSAHYEYHTPLEPSTGVKPDVLPNIGDRHKQPYARSQNQLESAQLENPGKVRRVK